MRFLRKSIRRNFVNNFYEKFLMWEKVTWINVEHFAFRCFLQKKNYCWEEYKEILLLHGKFDGQLRCYSEFLAWIISMQHALKLNNTTTKYICKVYYIHFMKCHNVPRLPWFSGFTEQFVRVYNFFCFSQIFSN